MHFRTIARLGRFREVIVTLLKYGFEDLVQRLEFPGIELLKKGFKEGKDVGTYVRIKHILEELGPTFIKIGQIMSLRPDLLPPDLVKELSKLQDQAATVDNGLISAILEKSLGGSIDQFFSEFNQTPFAAASLCQVHRAVLKKEGIAVAVKVQRPGIKRLMEVDLDILKAIADRLHERSTELKIYDLPNLFRVTRRNLLKELDFFREAKNMKIARSYKPDVYIPEVYLDYCSERVMVSEFIEGAALSEPSLNIADPHTIAKQGLNTAIKQILEDGYFHADPHPGNIIYSTEKGLCLLDWGMVGRLSERDRYDMIDLIRGIVEKDSSLLMDTLLRITAKERDVDDRALEREISEVLDLFFSGPIKGLNIGHLLLAITDILREYRLKLPSDLVIMIKALVTAEGTARQIYPELNVVTEAQTYIRKIASKRYRSEILWQAVKRAFFKFVAIQKDIPVRILRIADKIDRDELAIRFRHENLESLNHTLENISNRVAFSVIIAALIIGSSMIITTGIGPLFFGYPALGIIGYLISSLLGLWLIVIIIRTKKY
ncbi:MAG: AarF/ABC1/UbiB kinase family protein [Desulfatiglans sp.]|nr:AarF/ABC1/UbiB kinase family protein [Desulfatiglans sp.]